MELLHAVLVVVSWVILGVFVCWTVGWVIEEVEEARDARQKRRARRERARLAVRQARAIESIDRITLAAIREMGRIARDGRPDA